MNQALLLKRIEVYLRKRMGFDKYETMGIIAAMFRAAKVRGYELDMRFAEAGLTAGTGTRDLSLLILNALAGISPTEELKKNLKMYITTCWDYQSYSGPYPCWG